jgi:hypothetical protein
MRGFVVAIVCGSVNLAIAQPGGDPDGPPMAPPMQPQPYALPSPRPPGPAPGGARVTFVSASEQRWDVRLDDSAVCTTPCQLYVEPLHFVTMHSHARQPTRLAVGTLPPGDLIVTAKPRNEPLFVTGLTFTTLGGMAAVTGITLTAVGCSQQADHPTMCKAGLITGAAGLLVTFGSIRMIQQSLPTVSIGPAIARPYYGGNQVGLAGRF